MTEPSVRSPPTAPYSGIDNLEVMREAENYNRFLLGLIARHAGGATRAIDFGAGAGTFSVPCRDAGFDITAVEPDHELRRLLTAAGVRTVASVADLADGQFPYAFSLNVLEHIPDDVEALSMLRAKLAPGGRLFAYVPAFPVLFTSMDEKVGHVRRYTRATLAASLVAAGFEIDTLRYADSLGFVATLLFKAIDNGRGDVNRRMLRLYDRVALPVILALDTLTYRWFGKNIFAVARRPKS
jgi:SAM-dependent methyltransferase